MKKIKINNEVVEMMLFFWTSVSEREKVAEPYIISIADRDEMNLIYDEEFNHESVRRVLSAISNREVLNGGSARERKFWNNNMWMTEDLGVTQAMVNPIKQLNLEGEIENITTKSAYDEVELIFVPGTSELVSYKGNKIIVNFFKISVDVFGGTGEVTINGKPFKEGILEIIKEA